VSLIGQASSYDRRMPPSRSRSVWGGSGFRSRHAELDDVPLHYVIAGEGPAVILLYGFSQNLWAWRRPMPTLSQRVTVIAPDLRGLGIPACPPGQLTRRQWLSTSAPGASSRARSDAGQGRARRGISRGLLSCFRKCVRPPRLRARSSVPDEPLRTETDSQGSARAREPTNLSTFLSTSPPATAESPVFAADSRLRPAES
jgi:hypothetical protein